jgi:hypothetical protein
LIPTLAGPRGYGKPNVRLLATWLERAGVLILLGMIAGRASAQTYATINQMTVSTIDGYTVSYSASSQDLLLLGFPQTYYLNNGTTWTSGAGGFSTGYGSLISQTVTGGTIEYTLGLAPGDTDLMDYTDFDSGSHSSQGVLAPYGSMVLRASIGSKTAVLNGYAEIVSDTMTDYGEPAFNYYTAPVGDAVPFTVTYTLQGSPTWGSGIFATNFNYNTQGTIDFTQPVPEPSSLALLAAGALGLVGYDWRRRTVKRAAKPAAVEQDAPAILAFPSHSSLANSARRAA